MDTKAMREVLGWCADEYDSVLAVEKGLKLCDELDRSTTAERQAVQRVGELVQVLNQITNTITIDKARSIAYAFLSQGGE